MTMMYIVENEFDVRDFDFWCGARDAYEEYKRQDRLDELQQMIEDAFCILDRTPTDTEINDFVWFDEDVNKIFDDEDVEDGEEEVD